MVRFDLSGYKVYVEYFQLIVNNRKQKLTFRCNSLLRKEYAKRIEFIKKRSVCNPTFHTAAQQDGLSLNTKSGKPLVP